MFEGAGMGMTDLWLTRPSGAALQERENKEENRECSARAECTCFDLSI